MMIDRTFYANVRWPPGRPRPGRSESCDVIQVDRLGLVTLLGGQALQDRQIYKITT